MTKKKPLKYVSIRRVFEIHKSLDASLRKRAYRDRKTSTQIVRDALAAYLK